MLFNTFAEAMASGANSVTWTMYNGETKTTHSANNGNDSYTDNYVYIDKLTITATYTDAYDVTYNANGGTGAPAPQKKIKDTALTLSTIKPTKDSTYSTSTSTITVSYNANGGSSTPTAGTGTKTTITMTPYSFSTWNTAANGSGTSYASGASYTANAALTLYAQYTAGTASKDVLDPKIAVASGITRAARDVTGYKVTFNANGGSSTPSAVTSKRGATYSFKKWNSKSDGSGTIYDPGTSYSFGSNTTLYAIWGASYTNKAVTLASAISRADASAGSYTVTYNANGGSCSTTSASAARTTKYTFSKWNTKADGSGTDYSAGASYTPSAAVTLYAKWTSSTTTAAVTLPTPTRTGYTFKGWSTSSSATSGSTGSYTPTGNVTLYATWQINTWTVSYSANGGTSSTVPASQTKTYGQTLTLSTTTPTRNDSTTTYTVTFNANGGSVSPTSATATKTTKYTFSKWNTKSDGSGTDYNPGGSYTANSAATLYARWTSSSSFPSVTLPTPTRTGYNFKGWATSSTATSGSTGSYTPTGNVTLYATWEKKTYTIKYMANGAGGTVPANQTKTHGTTLTLRSTAGLTAKADTTTNGYKITLNANGGTVGSTSVQVRNTVSYHISGWNTTSSGTGVSYASGGSYTTNASATLYVKWSSSTTKGTATLPTPTRKGYTFNGWYTAATDGTKRNSGYTPTAAETLYAHWSENTYYVYYKNGVATSGTLPSTSTRKYTTNATIATNNMAKKNETASGYRVFYNQGAASSTTNLPSTQTSTDTLVYSANGWTTHDNYIDALEYANGATYGANTTNNLTLYPNFTCSKVNGGVTLSSNTMTKNNTTASGYTVTYKQGTASAGTVPSAQTATDTIKYTHDGWATSSDGSKAYNKGAATGALSNVLFLYPHFSSSRTRGSVTLATNSMTKSTDTNATYTITLNANSGSVSPTSLSTSNTTKYTANGWTTTSGSTSRTHSNNTSHQVTANLTLYPCFTRTTSTAAVTLPTPTRSGYTFKGWAPSTSATSGVTGSYTPSGNVTLHAIWSRNVSITKQPVDTTVTVGSDISVSVTAVGDGLTYQWYFKNAGSSSFSKSSIVTSTYTITMNQDDRIGRQVFCTITDANGKSQSSNIVTLNATYQVIYNANNGSGTMSNSTHDYRTAKALTANAFTRIGYSFLGWSTSPTATTATYTNGQSVSKLTYNSPTITLYAVWSQSQAFIHRYNSSSNKEKVRVWYYETASKCVPVKKVWYYNGTSWVDVTEGDNT